MVKADLNDTETFDWQTFHYGNTPLRVAKHKVTGEVFFNMDDVAKCLGYQSLDECLKMNPDMLREFSAMNAGCN